MKKNKGISLLVLLITIVVIIILAVAIILTLSKNNPIEDSKKARFYNNITTVQEAVDLAFMNTYTQNITKEVAVSNFGKMTDSEKEYVLKNIPTLENTVKLVTDNDSIVNRNMYWLDASDLGVNVNSWERNYIVTKAAKSNLTSGYIVDMDTLKVYNFEGDVFYNKRWHTLDYGFKNDVTPPNPGGGGEGGVDPVPPTPGPGDETENLPTGWMWLTLHYPAATINHQYKINGFGTTNTDWQNYTGPIMVKVEDRNKVSIRYEDENTDLVVVPPLSRLLVDIDATPKGPVKVDKVMVSITYEPNAKLKEYKIGNSGWQTYKGPFEIAENTTIQARVKKDVEVKDNMGNSMGITVEATDKTSKVINWINVVPLPDKDLEAPLLKQVNGVLPSEVAKVEVTYPNRADITKKVYVLNSGAEIEYSSQISITNYESEVKAYYYVGTKKSLVGSIVVREVPLKLDIAIYLQLDPQIDDTAESTLVNIEYDERATLKQYQIDNNPWQTYTEPFEVTKNCIIRAKAQKDKYIGEAVKEVKFKELARPLINVNVLSDEKATIAIEYAKRSVKNEFKIDQEPWQTIPTGTNYKFDVNKSCIVFAKCSDSSGNITQAQATVTLMPSYIAPPVISHTLALNKKKAMVKIDYPVDAIEKKYKIDNGMSLDYAGEFEVEKNCTIYATDKSVKNATNTATHVISDIAGITVPAVSHVLNSNRREAVVTIIFDEYATLKKYSYAGGQLQDYTAPFNVAQNTVIYAYEEDARGYKADVTYNITDVEALPVPKISHILNPNKQDAMITIDYDSAAIEKKYKLDSGVLTDYSAPIKVTSNCTVFASQTDNLNGHTEATYNVSDIALDPPVIEAVLSPNKQKATVSIAYLDSAKSKQYKIGNGPLTTYTQPFEVFEDSVIYAKHINEYNVSKDATYNISNIELAPPIIDVVISNDLQKATVNITYSNDSVKKLFKVGNTAFTTYTNTFDVYENCIIYAVAQNSAGKESSATFSLNTLVLDPPVISHQLSADKQSATVSIKYFDGAKVKQYKIDNEPLTTYTQPFEVKEDCVIYAINTNEFNISKDATYTISDIVLAPPVIKATLSLDKLKATIDITYPVGATRKQYKVGNTALSNYTKTFDLTDNCVIYAECENKFKKQSNATYNLDTIILNPPVVSHVLSPNKQKATVSIDFLSSAKTKQYKIDNGPLTAYTVPFEVSDDCTIYAIHENEFGKTADATYIISDIVLEPPVITAVLSQDLQKATVTIAFEDEAIRKQYKIDNGSLIDYTKPFDVTANCTIFAEHENNSLKKANASLNIDGIILNKPLISHVLSPNKQKATVTINFLSSAKTKQYKIDNGALVAYTAPFEVSEDCTIYAIHENEFGKTADATYIISDIALEPPVITAVLSQDLQKAVVTIAYENGSTINKYKIGTGELKEYSGPFEIFTDSTIYAVVQNAAGKTADATFLVTGIVLNPPVISSVLSPDTQKALVTIKFAEGATRHEYKIGNATLTNYTQPFYVTSNEVIYAVHENASGKISDATYTQTGIVLNPPVISSALSQDTQKSTVTIAYLDSAKSKQYKIDNGPLTDYTTPFEVSDNCTIYAKHTNEFDKSSDATYTVTGIVLNPPIISSVLSQDTQKAVVTIKYLDSAKSKKYKIGKGFILDYTGPIELEKNTTIYAAHENVYGKKAESTHDITGIALKPPVVSHVLSADKQRATVSIQFGDGVVKKQYKIDNGPLTDYTTPFEVLQNCTIYAVHENRAKLQSDTVYTISNFENIPVPLISHTLNPLKDKAIVKIEYANSATTKKYRINTGPLLDYTVPFEVSDNCLIYAENEGLASNVSSTTYEVSDIHSMIAPQISQNLVSNNRKAVISIVYDEFATTKQYSINAGPLLEYSAPFEVSQNNAVIYAVNTSSTGKSKDATFTLTGIINELSVEILANPPVNIANEIEVTINYDILATEKTYTINGGEIVNYTGPFKVSQKSLIEAFAKQLNTGVLIGEGKAQKQITNLPIGQVKPLITYTTAKETRTEGITIITSDVATLTIEYDKNAAKKFYKIGEELPKEYTAPFKVNTNAIIYAWSVDTLDNSSPIAELNLTQLKSTYVLAKEGYYLIKLDYPPDSINRQYKCLDVEGWRDYNNEGLIFIKPGYKEELFQGGSTLQIQLDDGRIVDFTNCWYLVQGTIEQTIKYLEVRWEIPNRKTSLQIIPLQVEAAEVVNVMLHYPKSVKDVQYSLDMGTTWTKYTTILNIVKNNTTIQAKMQYSDSTWSEIVSKTITNVEERLILDEAKITNTTASAISVSLQVLLNTENISKYCYKIDALEWVETDINTHDFTGLLSSTPHTILTKVKHINGSYSDEVVLNATTKAVSTTVGYSITPNLSPGKYTNTPVDITLDYLNNEVGYELQYKIGPKTQIAALYDVAIGLPWTKYVAPFKVIDNATVTTRIYNPVTLDEIAGANTLDIACIDTVNPNPANITLPITSTSANFNANVVLSDALSGVNVSQSKYMLRNNSTPLDPLSSEWNNAGTFAGTALVQALNLNVANGTYYLHVLTVDNASNKASTVSSNSIVVNVAMPPPGGTIYTDTNGAQVPLPAGFVVSSVGRENTVKNGLVIKQGSNPASTTSNEFVWVPVQNPATDYKRGVTGKESDISTGYTENDSDPTNIAIKNSVTMYKGFYIGRYETGLSDNAIYTGSEVDGTFWLNATPVVKKGARSWEMISQIKAKEVSKNIVNTANVKSTLINSYMWDTTLNYLIASGDKTQDEVISDSRYWGNYRNSSFTFTDASYSTDGKNYTKVDVSTIKPSNPYGWLLTTGATNRNSAKNIYDLAGNSYEWTTENYNGSRSASYRGGQESDDGNFYPAACRRDFNGISLGIGFRTGLIIELPSVGEGTRDKAQATWNKPYLPEGFNWLEGTVDKGYCIADTNGNEFVWVPVQNPATDYKRGVAGQGVSSSFTENDSDPTNIAIKNSVTKYKGFYIGRYETGLSDNAIYTGSEVDGTFWSNATPVVKKGARPWNYILQTKAVAVSKNIVNTASVKSTLINSYMWDTTLNYIISSNAKTQAEVISDSTSWGNYDNASFTFTDASYSTNWSTYAKVTASTNKPVNTRWLLTTGATNRNSAKNIHDLAGNLWEWTTENYNGSGSASIRGGACYNVGLIYAAYRNNDSVAVVRNNSGFRLGLYLL